MARNLEADLLGSLLRKGPVEGVEIVISPDVPVEPDAGYAAQGVERYGLRRVRRVRRVGWWFLVGRR